jgi:peptide/nickel transport system ATP-binding protein
MQGVRGKEISMIFQEPMTSLNPVLTIGRQIAEVLLLHLAVVAETAQRVIVMYAGRKVEEAPVDELFARPLHPYTRGLMTSIPRLGLMRGETEGTAHRLNEIPGMVPALTNLPQGCVFAPRCRFADERCRSRYPAYEEKQPGHWAACWHSQKLLGAGNG